MIDKKELIKLIKEKPSILKSVSDYSIQLKMVHVDGFYIQYIKNPSDEIQITAVKSNSYCISCIENPIPTVQLHALRTCSKEILLQINNPCEEAYSLAIQNDWKMIRFVLNPSDELKITALLQTCEAKQYIKEISEDIWIKVITQNPSLLLSFSDEITPNMLTVYRLKMKEKLSNKIKPASQISAIRFTTNYGHTWSFSEASTTSTF